ncbi:MAG: O-antigen ligase family protein [Chthoniobacter sp.]|nr:O-antigen ligase family protein [Chthoniobacter sp.]
MNIFLLILVVLALAITQVLAGGRQVFLCLPAYGLLALAAILSFWPRRRAYIPRGATECLCAALIFCAYISVRALLSPESYLARTDLYAALSTTVLYLVIVLNVTSSRLRPWLVGGLLALALANCAVGAVQVLKGQNFMLFPFLPRSNYETRASGFYGYPNHLSGFLEMALLLGLGFTFWSRWPAWAKMLAGYACAMCLLGILFTGSRGGYISVAVGLLVFLLLNLVLIGKLAKGRVFISILAGLILIAAAAWGVRQVMAKSFLVNSRSNETLTVDVSRMRLWQAAWQQFRLSPAVGTGSGTYLYYGRQFRSPGLQTDPIHAHNDYFELLAEYGIIGIICAVIFIETHLRRGWNSFSRRLKDGAQWEGMGSNSLALNVGALSAAAACLVHCLLDFNLHMPANLFTAAVVFGLLANPGDGREGSGAEESPGLPPFLRLVLPALGILFAVRLAPTAPAEYFTERTRLLLADGHRFTSTEPNEWMVMFAKRGLQSDPRNPELYYAMGQAQSTLGDLTKDPAKQKAFYAESIENYMHALEYAPGNVFNYLALGWTLDSAERFTESQPLYEHAVTLDPRSGYVHNAYADHLVTIGKLDEAAAQFQLGDRFGDHLGAQIGRREIEEARKQSKEKGPGTPAPADKPPAN